MNEIQAEKHELRVAVGRAINGISINGLEYLLNDEGEIHFFDSEEDAKTFLSGKGFTEEDLYELTFTEEAIQKGEQP